MAYLYKTSIIRYHDIMINMSKLKFKLSSITSVNAQQDVANYVLESGGCNLFDLKKKFPQMKMVSLQRALDFNKFKGNLEVSARNEAIKIPLSGDLRTLTFYRSTSALEIKSINKMQQELFQDIQKMSMVTRPTNYIEKYSKQAINSRTSLEMIWPSVMSVSVDDDDDDEPNQTEH